MDAATYHYCMAKVFATTGKLDPALQALNMALASGYKDRDRVRKDPAFKSLAADPRFQELLK